SLAVKFSARRTRRGMPAASVGLALEMRARDKRLSQISSIVHNRRNDEPLVAVRLAWDGVKVFSENRVVAVRHAVLPQISSDHRSRGDFQPAVFPGRTRVALQRWMHGLPCRTAESERASLGARVDVNTECAIVCPRNVQPRRLTHD